MASVISIYARAFADVVMERRLDAAKILQELQRLSALVASRSDLRLVWENPAIPAEQKRAVLDALVKREGFSQPVRNFAAVSYLNPMPKRPFEPCIPTRGAAVPAGPDWIHEIKHDGYRLIVQRQDKRACGCSPATAMTGPTAIR